MMMRLRRRDLLSSCLLLLLLVPLLVISSSFPGTGASVERSDDSNPTADCNPKDPLLASGQTLKLTCTMNRTSPGFTVDQVVCKFGEEEELSTTVIANDTFEVVKENVTRSMSHGHVFCYVTINGRQVKLAQVAIRVADMPTPPVITGCVVYNWQKMVCSWQESPETGLPTNYSLGWAVLGDAKVFACPHYEGNSCIWTPARGQDSLKMDMTYILMMRAKNELGYVVANAVDYFTGELVKPDPVQDVSLVGRTSRSLTVKWSYEWTSSERLENSRRLLNYMIIYKSQWDDAVEMRVKTLENVTTLEDLIPNTSYTVTLQCIPYAAKDTENDTIVNEKGFWSNKTIRIYSTEDDVPARAPAVTAGGYEVMSSDDETRTVEIFWIPLHKKHQQGDLLGYRIRWFNMSGEIIDQDVMAESRNPAYYAEIRHLPLNIDVGVTVEARTKKGFNDSLSLDVVWVPAAESVPEKPDLFYAVGNESEITAIWSCDLNATGFTVFWCQQDHVGYCKLNWTVLPATARNFTMLGHPNFHAFRVSMSVEAYSHSLKRVVSSGMVRADCVHDVSKPVQMPLQPHFARDQKANSLTVEWTEPVCGSSAYIVNYELSYCRVAKCDGHDCCIENKTMNVSKSEKRIIIEGLEAEAKYQVRIRSCSVDTVSEYTAPITQDVKRSGLTSGVIAAIVIAGFVVLVLLAVGLTTIAKKIKKYFNCCEQIKIVPPPAVVLHIDKSKSGEANIDYHPQDFLSDLPKDEQTSLLTSNGGVKIQEANHSVVYRNGNGIHKSSDHDLQPLIGTDLGRNGSPDSGVPPSHDSSISPYSHLAAPDEIPVTLPLDLNEIDRHSVGFTAGHILPPVELQIASSTFPVEEPIVSKILPSTYMTVETIPAPVNSSSAITPYATVEQILDDTKADFTSGVEADDGVRLAEAEQITLPGSSRNVVDYVSDAETSRDDMLRHPALDVDVQQANANHNKLTTDSDIFRDDDAAAVVFSSSKLLPVGYIPLAPKLST